MEGPLHNRHGSADLVELELLNSSQLALLEVGEEGLVISPCLSLKLVHFPLDTSIEARVLAFLRQGLSLPLRFIEEDLKFAIAEALDPVPYVRFTL